jgi:hypothetical protein
MISMALFGLIAAGALSLVMSGARMQAHSSRVDVAQTALRTAIDMITRDVVGASAGAKSGSITNYDGTVHSTIDFTDYNNAAGTETWAPVAHTDRLDLWNVDGSAVAQANSALAAGATSIPFTYEQGVTGAFAYTTSPYASRVQISDLTNAWVVTLTGTPTTSLPVSSLPTTFSGNPYVMPSRHVVYYVSKAFGEATTNINGSMLMMQVNDSTAVPLAEGVEDMQIAYGFDNDGSGTLPDNGNSTDEWLYNAAGDSALSFVIGNLRSVRVTLVVKSTSVDSGQKLFSSPSEEDHVIGSPTLDGFVRRVLRTEIKVRNFSP